MLSQYSWGDFFKFILALAIPYYAFVIIKYYREDIREWISNRGQKPAPADQDTTDDDEADHQPLFATTSYVTPTVALVAAAPVVETRPATQPETAQFGAGPVIAQDDDVNGFDLSGVGEVTRPDEQSLTDLVETAKGLVVDEQGTVAPADQDDQAAVKLANVINTQRGKAALSGFNFNR